MQSCSTWLVESVCHLFLETLSGLFEFTGQVLWQLGTGATPGRQDLFSNVSHSARA